MIERGCVCESTCVRGRERVCVRDREKERKKERKEKGKKERKTSTTPSCSENRRPQTDQTYYTLDE